MSKFLCMIALTMGYVANVTWAVNFLTSSQVPV